MFFEVNKVNVSLYYLKDKFKNILGEVENLEPIGNHELKRNLVYKVYTKSNKYVLKLFYKKNRWDREIAALRILEDTPVNVPKIVDHGILDNGIEYLIYTYIDGIVLKEIEKLIPKENLKSIYKEIGLQLSLIHSNAFDFFGTLDKNLNSTDGFNTYREYFQKSMDDMLKKIYSQEHDYMDLLKIAEEKLRSMYYLLDEVEVPILCHNDFSTRNILVRKIDGKYTVVGIIDFEHSSQTDVYSELVEVYYGLFKKDFDFAKWFKSGYEQYGKIDMEKLEEKKQFYNLSIGLGICSWAKDVAYDYYLEGINMLKETLERSINIE